MHVVNTQAGPCNHEYKPLRTALHFKYEAITLRSFRGSRGCTHTSWSYILNCNEDSLTTLGKHAHQAPCLTLYCNSQYIANQSKSAKICTEHIIKALPSTQIPVIGLKPLLAHNLIAYCTLMHPCMDMALHWAWIYHLALTLVTWEPNGATKCGYEVSASLSSSQTPFAWLEQAMGLESNYAVCP